MPVHYFVRLRPPPGDGRGIREMTIGGRLFSADVGWVLLDRAEAVALRTVYHPDEKARYMFSYAFDVAEVAYPDVMPDWIISAGQPADARYYAELVVSHWNEFVAFPYAAHVFKANTGWLPVTREQAEFLQLTHSLLLDPRSPRAFGVRVKPALAPAPAPDEHVAVPAALTVVDREFEPPVPATLHPPSEPSPEAGPELAEDELSDEQVDDDIDTSPETGVEALPGGLSLEERVVIALKGGPLGTSEIARALGLNGTPGSLYRALQALLASKTVELTMPDKPGSRLQKYRVVAEGAPSSVESAAPADVPAPAAEALLEAHPNIAELAGIPDAPMTSPHADAPTVVARVMDGGRGADHDGARLPASRESDKA